VIMAMDEIYMKRCFDLAANGLGTTHPNPLVGSVIVKDDKILAEGWHRKAGEPHAERMAVSRVSSPEDLEGATVYVNLEPCSHYGRTPPCADLLVSSKVGRVVISNMDPNPSVSGRGIQRLKDAGVEVETGILEKEGEYLNRRFFHFQRTKKPYIILKWAESTDGFIDGVRDGNIGSLSISGADSSRWVHKWRSQEQAIAVGKNTVINDDPSLTTRKWAGDNPIPIVLGFREDVKNRKLHTREDSLWYNDLGFDKNEGRPEWNEVLTALGKREITSVLVEGGQQILNSLMADKSWNEIRRFVSKKNTIFQGLKAPNTEGFEPVERFENEEDQLFIYTSAS
jgi:diaminohydroxyphosphoribosylaminopyrimidine deaminase/5-amino-6-(5-phosphoribosylamino)uracil reductase